MVALNWRAGSPPDSIYNKKRKATVNECSRNCGSATFGYMVEIQRETDDQALVCVTLISKDDNGYGGGQEWMKEVAVAADTDLQALAKNIARSPELSVGKWAERDPEEDEDGEKLCEWNDYADRWRVARE